MYYIDISGKKGRFDLSLKLHISYKIRVKVKLKLICQHMSKEYRKKNIAATGTYIYSIIYIYIYVCVHIIITVLNISEAFNSSTVVKGIGKYLYFSYWTSHRKKCPLKPVLLRV